MNDIIHQPDRRPPTRQDAPSRGATIAASLRSIHQGMIKPFEEMIAMMGMHQEALRLAYKTPQINGATPRCESARVHNLTVLKGWLEKAPAPHEAQALADRYAQIADRTFSKDKAVLIIGLMIDAFPNARPHEPQAFIESLVHQMEAIGFSPFVVAKACNEIVRKAKFLPAVSEVLEACWEEKRTAGNCAGGMKRIATVAQIWASEVERLESVTGLPDEDPDPRADRGRAEPPAWASDDEWRQRVKGWHEDCRPWNREWGEKPGREDCYVPYVILTEFGFGGEPGQVS